MLQEGQLFAERYKFIRQLGRGGFAEVWLAEDTMTGVEVAVKVYAPGPGLDENGLKIFKQEFSLVFDMNHTNLLRPTHFDCWERMPYLIMPLCKNGSAFKYIVGTERITEEACWNLLHDVAAGLAYLHEKEPPLIHQDIKPDNILINDEGHYMITDFGISARVRSTIRGGQAQEQSGGTLAYMGPERFSSNPKPIMASDVWSLGAMMYEIMTGGTPPFGNHGGVLQKNGADIPVIEEDFSQELKDIVYSCLSKETWDRPSARKIEEMTYNKLHGIVMPAEGVAQQSQQQTEEEAKKPAEAQEPQQPKKKQKQQKPPQAQEPSKQQEPPLPPKQQNAPKPQNSKMKLYGAIAAAIVVIGILIALFSGGGDKEEPVVVVPTAPAVNYDSLAQIKIDESKKIAYEADTLIEMHPDDYTDRKYGTIENTYFNALERINEALDNKDSLSADVRLSAETYKNEIVGKLYGVYKVFQTQINEFKEYGIADSALAISRANTILPIVKGLIEAEKNINVNPTNNETNDEQNP